MPAGAQRCIFFNGRSALLPGFPVFCHARDRRNLNPVVRLICDFFLKNAEDAFLNYVIEIRELTEAL
jgi:hypothetical protein